MVTGNEFRLEEYKQVFALVVDVERRLLQVLGATVTVGVTFLTATSGFLLLHSSRRPLSVAEAYFTLFPLILLIPSFSIVLGLRLDIARFAAYIVVFYEDGNPWPRWNSSLIRFRSPRLFESNDPVPYTYWLIAAGFLGLFFYALAQSASPVRTHIWIVFPICIVLGHIHRIWRTALYEYYQLCIEEWRRVRTVDLGTDEPRNV
jgi:hypothetical protein